MRVGIVVSYFVLSLSPAFSVCPTGNNLANSAYVAETFSWTGYEHNIASSQTFSFSEILMELITFRFESTATTSRTHPGFSDILFRERYKGTLFNGTTTGSISLSAEPRGFIFNSISANALSPQQFFYTYNVGIVAPRWEDDPNNVLNAIRSTATQSTYPSGCYIYIWLTIPKTSAPYSPPDVVAVTGNSGTEIFGHQVNKGNLDPVQVKKFRAIRQ